MTRIRPIVLALIRRGDQLLVLVGTDETKPETFARPLGGGIEPGERAEDALRREIREELGLELVNVRRLDVVENIFRYQGEPGHEIVFLFEAEFDDRSAYESESLPGLEGDEAFTAHWLSPRELQERGWPLYPDGLPEILQQQESARRALPGAISQPDSKT